MSSGGGMESVARAAGNNGQAAGRERCGGGGYFQMPLHYPRYTSGDYEIMPEWKLDCLLREY